jgi:hypothetical protein
MSVKEIESAVSRLSGAELARFSEWFDAFAAKQLAGQTENASLNQLAKDDPIHSARGMFAGSRLTSALLASRAEERRRG